MRTTATIVILTLAFTAAWLAFHPTLPQLPTGDVYTSLSVARHLSRGEGFVNDTIYPLFTAHAWGREIPQPLLHRPPGLAVLLLPAWLLAGGDPVSAESLVRPTMAVILGLLALLGLAGLRRQQCLHGGVAWLLILLVNPLFALAALWGWGEIPAACLLMALWLLARRRHPADFSPAAAAAYAALAGLLALLRSDLLWIPVLWWVVAALVDRRRRLRRAVRRTALAAAVGVALLLPWWIHVAGHLGSPFANPLTDAIQLDLREPWWDYPLLRSRTPIPLGENLQARAWPALLKVGAGARNYARTLGCWLPWLIWLGCSALWGLRTWERTRRGRDWVRAAGPPGLLALTTCLMVLQYAFFSPETRHMLPLMPLLAWEGVLMADARLRRLLPAALLRGIGLAAAVGIALVVTPARLGGEWGNVDQARTLAAQVDELTAAAAALPPGPVFSDNAVVPWRTDRAYIWKPLDAAVEAEIRAVMPAMRDAPYLRLLPASRDAGGGQ
ncbi:MAG TPA: hypothetical protein PLL30_10335 [Candidatus Krumholzibacteria bacterium]|nr:hypothetical protein [Candidatus Krumholzibacteria bacterium]HPD72159.1 hypothetical protein [Candidatus Krumholzibacteria bacterium]HRY40909.1 hypothetical protein [Candidatus Krumholzibacteria bacterium]